MGGCLEMLEDVSHLNPCLRRDDRLAADPNLRPVGSQDGGEECRFPSLCLTNRRFITTLFVLQMLQPFLPIPPVFSAFERRQLIMETRQTLIQF